MLMKKILVAGLIAGVILLILFGQFSGLNEVFAETIPNFSLWVFVALVVIVIAYLLKKHFPLFSKIIFIIAAAIFPALAVAVLTTILMLIIYSWMRGSSVACDMGGGGILSLLLGIAAGVITYTLILIIGIGRAIFKHLRKRKS